MRFKDIVEKQEDKVFLSMCSKVEIHQGDKVKVMDIAIPNLILYELDPQYYTKCIEIDGKYSVGLESDNGWESFEGFEEFMEDFIDSRAFTKTIILPKDSHKLHTALRFNKEYIYEFSDEKINDYVPHINKCSPKIVDRFIKEMKEAGVVNESTLESILSLRDDIRDRLIKSKKGIFGNVCFTFKKSDIEKLSLDDLSKIGPFYFELDETKIFVEKTEKKYKIYVISREHIEISGNYHKIYNSYLIKAKLDQKILFSDKKYFIIIY